ncbi:hypothetical protein [Methylobacterium platani]|uniref:Uncharacterized protein n=2 Tax=Methylobacterium platani TaxID=427683 RepID=A0A179SHF8_9HYPH|nr:hypothetical protein [Methylobacterium platani]KMO21401.1 hypothetical protein SQ03_03355 [Methylobacterium platani JCM 14648]OAS26321.1 hypothetical protein A5481_06295 [Methylobacterium platani]
MGADTNPTAAEEIRLGVANSCLKLPKDATERRELVQALFDKADRQKNDIANAKSEAGLQSHENRLQNVFGVARATQRILKVLGPLKPGDRAAVLTQTGLLSQDMGWCDKDLVMMAEEAEAVAGQGQDDQGSMFDKTTAGARMGGEPTPVEPGSTPPEPGPTPGLSVEEYTRRFQEAHDAWKAKGGRGRRPKALVDAEKDLEEAKRAAEKPTHEQMREANAEGDAHIRKQVAESGGSPVPDTAHRGDEDEDIDDEIPGRGPLAGATGQGTYTIN